MVIYAAVGIKVKVRIESWYRLRIPLVHMAISVMVKTFYKNKSSFYDVNADLYL
jgi:hypothetical protein